MATIGYVCGGGNMGPQNVRFRQNISCMVSSYSVSYVLSYIVIYLLCQQSVSWSENQRINQLEWLITDA